MSIYGSYLTEAVKFDGNYNKRYKTTNLTLEGVKVAVRDSSEDKLDQLEKDFKVLKKEYKSYIDSKFIPWLKGSKYKDISDKELKNSIKLESIDYGYTHTIAKYSPTGKDDYFGEFELMYRPTNNAGKEVFDVASITLYIKGNKVVKATCTDV